MSASSSLWQVTQAEQQRPRNRKRWHSFKVCLVGQGRRRKQESLIKLQQAKSEELPGGMKREHTASCERERCGRQALKRAESGAGC